MYDNERTRRRFLTGAGVTVAFGLAGCTSSSNQDKEDEDDSSGEGHSDAHGASLDGPSASATVTMATKDDGEHFEPHVVWVEPGGSVTWELDSGSHTTTAYAEKTNRPQRIPDEASAWDSGTVSEGGATFEHTFETPGVYDYLCLPHETTGMIGTVIVGDPDTESQPGLQPPQEELPDEAAKKIESLNQQVTEALDGSGDGQGDSTDGHDHSGDGH